jgi:hypothetical protein
MLTRFQQIDSLDDLRDYITLTICEHYELQIGAFPLTERILLRGRKPCGIFFCLHGPRLQQFSAIWETDRNQILFYNCDGQRFLKTQLIEAPRLECAAA